MPSDSRINHARALLKLFSESIFNLNAVCLHAFLIVLFIFHEVLTVLTMVWSLLWRHRFECRWIAFFAIANLCSGEMHASVYSYYWENACDNLIPCIQRVITSDSKNTCTASRGNRRSPAAKLKRTKTTTKLLLNDRRPTEIYLQCWQIDHYPVVTTMANTVCLSVVTFR